jgi:hypothetical protein
VQPNPLEWTFTPFGDVDETGQAIGRRSELFFQCRGHTRPGLAGTHDEYPRGGGKIVFHIGRQMGPRGRDKRTGPDGVHAGLPDGKGVVSEPTVRRGR